MGWADATWPLCHRGPHSVYTEGSSHVLGWRGHSLSGAVQQFTVQRLRRMLTGHTFQLTAEAQQFTPMHNDDA